MVSPLKLKESAETKNLNRKGEKEMTTAKILKQQAYCQTCKKVTVFKKPAPSAKETEMLLNDINSVKVAPWKCDGITSKHGNRFEGCGAIMK